MQVSAKLEEVFDIITATKLDSLLSSRHFHVRAPDGATWTETWLATGRMKALPSSLTKSKY